MKFLSYITLTLTLLTSLSTLAGQDRGNGGGQIGLDFTQAAFRAIAALVKDRDQLPDDLKQIDIKLLNESVKNTRLEILQKFDRQVDLASGATIIPTETALNFPEQGLIKISEEKWDALAERPKFQIAIALHEYLGIVGLERNLYYLSAQLESFLSSELISNRLANLKPGVYSWAERDANRNMKLIKIGLNIQEIDLGAKALFGTISTEGDNNTWKGREVAIFCDDQLAQRCSGTWMRGKFQISIMNGGDRILYVDDSLIPRVLKMQLPK